jgi:hypothetical protein
MSLAANASMIVRAPDSQHMTSQSQQSVHQATLPVMPSWSHLCALCCAELAERRQRYLHLRPHTLHLRFEGPDQDSVMCAPRCLT